MMNSRKAFHLLFFVSDNPSVISLVLFAGTLKQLFLMTKASYPSLRAAMALFTAAFVLLACEKELVNPSESISASARTKADSTANGTPDSTSNHESPSDSSWYHGPDSTHWTGGGHFPDSSRHHVPDSSRYHGPDSTHWPGGGHFPDSSRVKPPLDSTRRGR